MCLWCFLVPNFCVQGSSPKWCAFMWNLKSPNSYVIWNTYSLKVMELYLIAVLAPHLYGGKRNDDGQARFYPGRLRLGLPIHYTTAATSQQLKTYENIFLTLGVLKVNSLNYRIKQVGCCFCLFKSSLYWKTWLDKSNPKWDSWFNMWYISGVFKVNLTKL